MTTFLKTNHNTPTYRYNDNLIYIEHVDNKMKVMVRFDFKEPISVGELIYNKIFEIKSFTNDVVILFIKYINEHLNDFEFLNIECVNKNLYIYNEYKIIFVDNIPDYSWRFYINKNNIFENMMDCVILHEDEEGYNKNFIGENGIDYYGVHLIEYDTKYIDKKEKKQI